MDLQGKKICEEKYMRTILINGKVITPEGIIENVGVIVENGVIEQIVEGGHGLTEEGNDPSAQAESAWNLQENDEVIDVQGHYISPGFIDLHTHGGGGHDFMDGTFEAIIEGTRAHMKYGTTSIVPTTLSGSSEDLYRTLDLIKACKEAEGIPNILGVHLEGPYFSMEQRGAQDPKYIRNPEREEYESILNYSGDIVRWTVAPELPGALELGRELKKRGIVASIGHSDATYEEVAEAYENGYNLLTHFYSGMSMVRRINMLRYAGVVESGYLIDDMYVEVIADGMHLPESLLRLIYKIKGPDKICLVTDSMRAAGCQEGEYVLGNLTTGQKVVVEDGVAKLLDRTAFAGSVATTDRLVRTMVQIAKVPLADAVKMMTLTPARVMGIDGKKGSITVGKDADIVVFDENINIKMVMVRGKLQIHPQIPA